MRNYEIMTILTVKATKDARDKLIKEIENNFKLIIKKDEWGIRDLAYEIDKEKQGYYLVYYVETDTKGIENLKHLTKIHKPIIRNMILLHQEWPKSFNLIKGE